MDNFGKALTRLFYYKNIWMYASKIKLTVRNTKSGFCIKKKHKTYNEMIDFQENVKWAFIYNGVRGEAPSFIVHCPLSIFHSLLEAFSSPLGGDPDALFKPDDGRKARVRLQF